MDLLHMYQFKIVAENNSVSKAAEQLYVSQPGLSKVLSKLEKELGCTLFDRNKNSLALNENGMIALDYVNRILNLSDEFKNRMNELGQMGDESKIRIVASSNTFANYILEQYLQQTEKVPLNYHYSEQKNLLSVIKKDSADIVFSVLPLEDDDIDIYNMQLCREILGCCVPRSSPCSRKKELNIDEIKDKEFIRFKSIGNLDNKNGMSIADEIFAKQKIAPNYIFTSDSETLYNQMLENLNCWGLSTNISWSRRTYKGHVFVPFADKTAKYFIYASYRKEKEAKLEPFITWLKKNYESLFLSF